MNKIIYRNYTKLSVLLFLLPIVLLVKIALVLLSLDALSISGYIHIQKQWFYVINSYLKQYPETLANLTQFGDALIFLSLLSIFILYVPKMWESLVTGSLFSLIFSVVIKESFSIPRPAAAFDYTTFTIIGQKLSGSTSFPSGHSITIFTILTVLMFTFIPKNKNYRLLYFTTAISLGLAFAFTRVAVGAHYPLDVIVGSIIGYISGLLGIYINTKYRMWNWVYNKRYYPCLVIVFMICCGLLIQRINNEMLLIYYFSLASLLFTIYKTLRIYVYKTN